MQEQLESCTAKDGCVLLDKQWNEYPVLGGFQENTGNLKMSEQIDFASMAGPMVLWFDGEGRDCLLCDAASQVIDYLMDEEGASWSLDGTRDELLECLNNEDNWTFNESGQPFQVSVALGEISTFHVIVKCRRSTVTDEPSPFRHANNNPRSGMGYAKV